MIGNVAHNHINEKSACQLFWPTGINIAIIQDATVEKVPPKSLLGKAVNYTLNEWGRLVRYIEDGRMSFVQPRIFQHPTTKIFSESWTPAYHPQKRLRRQTRYWMICFQRPSGQSCLSRAQNKRDRR